MFVIIIENCNLFKKLHCLPWYQTRKAQYGNNTIIMWESLENESINDDRLLVDIARNAAVSGGLHTT